MLARAEDYPKPTGNTVVICTTKSPGFDMLIESETGPAESFLSDWGPDGMLIDHTHVEGYDSDLRQLMFNGSFGKATVPTSLTDHGFGEYKLRWVESYEISLQLTRMGVCDIAFSPFTITAYRQQCGVPLTDAPYDASCWSMRRCNATTHLTGDNSSCIPGRFGWEAITPAHNCCINFTVPYFKTGMALLYVEESTDSTTNLIQTLFKFKYRMMNAISFLIVAIIVSGHVMWILERHFNGENFPVNYLDGIDHAVWWSAVTVTTVGYGDLVPITFPGRAFGFIWMFVGLLICAYFTGTVVSLMEYQRLEGQHMTSLDDFTGMRVCTTEGYATSRGDLANLPLDVIVEPSYDTCVDALDKGLVDALWYDKPMLDYEINARSKEDTWTTTNIDAEYAIDLAAAFPEHPRLGMEGLRDAFDSVLHDAIHLNAASYLKEPWFDKITVHVGIHDEPDDDFNEPLYALMISFLLAYLLLQCYKIARHKKSRKQFRNTMSVCMGSTKKTKYDSKGHREDKLDLVLKRLADIDLRLERVTQHVGALATHSGVRLSDAPMGINHIVRPYYKEEKDNAMDPKNPIPAMRANVLYIESNTE